MGTSRSPSTTARESWAADVPPERPRREGGRAVPARYAAPRSRSHPDRLGAMGDSVGGYFASLLALSGDSPKLANPHTGDAHHGVSTRLKVAVPVYGWFDLLRVWEHNQLDAAAGSRSPRRTSARSPMENPRHLLRGLADQLDDDPEQSGRLPGRLGHRRDIADYQTQSIPFVTALKRAGTYTRTVPIEGAPHFWILRADRRTAQLCGLPGAKAPAFPERAPVGVAIRRHVEGDGSHQHFSHPTKAGAGHDRSSRWPDHRHPGTAV